MNVQQLAKSDAFILRAQDCCDPSASTAFGKFEKRGVLLRVAKGAYVLVPEAMREPGTNWRPPIESVALGLASVEHGPSKVALMGPSAARTHGCLPRPLGVATVSYPSTRTRIVETLVGPVKLYARSIERMDVVRVSTDLAVGLATSIEMTMLDLLSGGPKKWPIDPSDRAEAIRLLAGQADWGLVDEIAQRCRKKSALKNLAKFGLSRDSSL